MVVDINKILKYMAIVIWAAFFAIIGYKFYAVKVATAVNINNGRIVIDSWGHHIEGTLAPDTLYELVLKDMGIAINTFSGNAYVSLFEKAKADYLKAKYGDFRTCGTAGVNEAIACTRSMIMVTDSPEAAKAINEAVSHVRNSRMPVVRLNASKINVTSIKYYGMNVIDNTGTPYYYVRSFSIDKPGYF